MMLMKKISQPILLSLLLASCAATEFTPEGATVRIVTENQKENSCEAIKLISTRVGTSQDKAGSALRQALNESAAIGANGFYILSQNMDWAIGATVTGEALNC